MEPYFSCFRLMGLCLFKLFILYLLRACLKIEEMYRIEQNFRQTRRIFEGIISLWQGNSTKNDGKFADFGRFGDFQTRP